MEEIFDYGFRLLIRVLANEEAGTANLANSTNLEDDKC